MPPRVVGDVSGEAARGRRREGGRRGHADQTAGAEAGGAGARWCSRGSEASVAAGAGRQAWTKAGSREVRGTEPGLTGCGGAAPLCGGHRGLCPNPGGLGAQPLPIPAAAAAGPQEAHFLKGSLPPRPRHTGPTCRAAPGQLAQGSEGRAQVTRIPSSLDRMSPALVAKATAPRTTPASRRPLSPWSRQAGPVTPPPRPSHRGRSRGGWPLARPRGHLLSPGAATVPCWLVLGAGLVLVLSPGYVQEGPGAS